MERAEARLPRGLLEVDLGLRIVVDPKCCFHRAATVARRRLRLLARLAGNGIDKAGRKNLADLVEADVAVAICCRLGQLTQYHQLRQWRRRADPPNLAA